MTISDIRTRIEAERSCLVTRTAEPNDAKSTEKADPLIQALVDKLPKPNAIWSIEDRARWLKAAAMAFNLIYKTREREIAGLQQTPEQAATILKSVG